jgi:hypothetical protein
MSTKQNTKILRLVKTILDIIFGLLIFASVFLAIWIVLSPVILNVTDVVIMSSVPVAIGTGSEPRIEVEVAGADARGIQNAYLDEAQGTLRLETSDWYLIFISNLAKLLTALIFISNLAKLLTAIGITYVIYLLRSLIKAILQGDVFTEENVMLMRRTGYMVLIVAFVKAAAEYFAAYEILRQLTIVKPPLSLPSPFQSEVILASLLILVLAQVWSYGLELERERALTI